MKMKNNKERVFYLIGNTYFTEKDSFTYEIPYKQAIKIYTIIGDIMRSQKTESGEKMIEGTILSFNFENSDKTICVVKDKDENVYNIDISDMKIFDCTGKGHLHIYINDEVNVFYKSQDSTTADWVFVTKTTMY